MKNLQAIIAHLDKHIEQNNMKPLRPVTANEILEKAGLLNDSKHRRGLPLRNILREGLIPHAYQEGGKGSNWFIPHSNKT
jgi:hypothetical protein